MKLKSVLKRILYKTDAILLKIFGKCIFKKKQFERAHLSLDDCWEVLINNRGGYINGAFQLIYSFIYLCFIDKEKIA